MLTWPHGNGGWAGFLADVEPVFIAIAREIAQRENLLINFPDALTAERATNALLSNGVTATRLFTTVLESNDTWARDHGPITVLEGDRPRLLDFRFNGWGNKYPSQADDALTGRLAALGVFDAGAVEAVDLVLEGGSIDSDGAGTVLTTTSCLLNPHRNPELSREQLENRLLTLFGAERLLWLEHGAIEGDDTDGHIDMLARFADPGTIIYQGCDETGYSAYAELQAMQAELERFITADGKPYRLARLPWPGPKHAPDGARMPASYANFLVINGAVLVPAYNDPADDPAAQQIQQCFPHHDVVQVHCLPLIRQHGSLHCLTMQLPAAVQLRAPVDTLTQQHDR